MKLTPKEDDLVFSDIPFEDLIIDEWGCPIEWKAEDTGNYSGAPKIFKLGKTLDLTKYKRCIVPYILEVDKAKEIPYGGIQIAFVDKMGNETTNIYLDIFTSVAPVIINFYGLYSFKINFGRVCCIKD